MRKTFFVLALLLAVLPLRAERVPVEKAQVVARAVFQHDRNAALRMAPLRQVELASAPRTKAGEERPAFYIFNRAGGGFVIVAGEDVCTPVLAYSYTNRFETGDDMPANLKEWLGELETLVAFARTDNSRAPQDVRAWAALTAPTKAGGLAYEAVVKHETPVWKQTAPFNRLTPVVDGSHAVIGCVPLAMGMIMRYHGYPPKGEGSLPSYSYTLDNGSTCDIAGFDLGHPYEWDKIKFNYNDDYTEEEAEAVARLVYDCGVAVQAKFDESTSASTPTMAGCAVTYFGFDSAAYHYKRALFTDEEWLQMLKDELQQRPILYSARRETGGHAFLVDGYDDAGNLSVNWGWGGSCNGYYALSAFVPTDSRQYLYQHGAVFGLQPKQGGSAPAQEYLYYQGGTASSGTVYNGLTTDFTTLRPGEAFTVNVGYLYNGGIQPFAGDFCVVLVDAQGEIKDYLSTVRNIETLKAGSGRGYPKVNCTMRRFPMPGDYIEVVYRSSAWPEGVWEKPLYDLSSTIVSRLEPIDDTKIAEISSLRYSKTTGELILETKDGAEWTLTNSSGTKVTEGVVYDITTMTFKVAELPKSDYTLKLTRGEEKLELKLKMGTK